MAGATVVMGAIVFAARLGLAPHAGHAVGVVALGVMMAAGLGAYGGMAQVLGIVNVVGIVKRRLAALRPRAAAGV